MHFAVTILGNNSAIPANGRHPTSQVVTLRDQLFLVDCGEGTQLQMSSYKIKKSKISHIFISHLHGDHYFGLIGLLNTFGLLGRTAPLFIHAPKVLEAILQLQLDCAHTLLPYSLHFQALEDSQNGILMEEKRLEISAFPTNHHIDCYGFLFKEKHPRRKIAPEKIKPYSIPYSFYENLQRGEDFKDEKGHLIKNEMLTSDSPGERSYAFCADTRYDEHILKYISHCDLMYHETTYLHEEAERAQSRYHSTALQAAMLAEKAKAKQLLIGHYSSKYKELMPFEKEARSVFKNTVVSQEGTTYLVGV